MRGGRWRGSQALNLLWLSETCNVTMATRRSSGRVQSEESQHLEPNLQNNSSPSGSTTAALVSISERNLSLHLRLSLYRSPTGTGMSCALRIQKHSGKMADRSRMHREEGKYEHSRWTLYFIFGKHYNISPTFHASIKNHN